MLTAVPLTYFAQAAAAAFFAGVLLLALVGLMDDLGEAGPKRVAETFSCCHTVDATVNVSLRASS